jgi:succinyl-diaminopimelate desuccinylase
MLLKLLETLVAMDSSNKEGANQAVSYCANWLTDQKLSVEVIENNGYKMLVSEIGSGPKTIIFNGHVDVVSGKTLQFVPEVKNGNLYGRGAADMKAGVAALMCAMAELRDTQLPIKIQLQIVSDEETGGANCSGFLANQEAYRGDFVICAEPTQLGIGLQAKGILQLDIEIRGRAAHGSRPWEGINAIEKAYSVYKQIQTLPFASEKTDFYASPSINLAKIHAGDIYNKVPNVCVTSLDIRYLPTQKKEDILSQIESVTDEKITVIHSGIPVQSKEDSLYINKLKQVIEHHTRQEPVIFGQHGSADTVYYAAQEIPAIEFGPIGANWHGDSEYVELDSVFTYQQMLVDFVKNISTHFLSEI